jgi:hypothetical protein
LLQRLAILGEAAAPPTYILAPATKEPETPESTTMRFVFIGGGTLALLTGSMFAECGHGVTRIGRDRTMIDAPLGERAGRGRQARLDRPVCHGSTDSAKGGSNRAIKARLGLNLLEFALSLNKWTDSAPRRPVAPAHLGAVTREPQPRNSRGVSARDRTSRRPVESAPWRHSSNGRQSRDVCTVVAARRGDAAAHEARANRSSDWAGNPLLKIAASSELRLIARPAACVGPRAQE